MDNPHNVEDNVEDTAVLPPLEAVYGEDAHSNIDLEEMLAVAFDPATPDPGSELVPDGSEEPVDLGDLSDADDEVFGSADGEAASDDTADGAFGADDYLAGLHHAQDDQLAPHSEEEFGGSANIPELDEHFGEDTLHNTSSIDDNYDGF